MGGNHAPFRIFFTNSVLCNIILHGVKQYGMAYNHEVPKIHCNCLTYHEIIVEPRRVYFRLGFL